MNLQEIGPKAIEIVKEVGAFIRKEALNFNTSLIEYKGKNDLVSYVDKTAEKQLVEALQRLIPSSGFITEEKTINKQSDDYNWIIDPLDGTTNFSHSLPPYCISVALMNKNKIILGIVYEVVSDECFYSWEGTPAYLNGKEIKVSEVDSLDKSLIATGFPTIKYNRIKEYMEVFNYCMINTHGLRRLGSAAIDLAYVACGRFEVFYEYGLNPWDVAAGAFLVQQAGGKVSDFKGGNDYLFGEEMCAANAKTHDSFLTVIKQHFQKV
jgi:myo-inositol-1(or 4)-monophosphatase